MNRKKTPPSPHKDGDDAALKDIEELLREVLRSKQPPPLSHNFVDQVLAKTSGITKKA